MSDPKMSILVAKTGHVLGALVRNGNPEGKLEPAQIVGAGVPVRDPKDYDRSVSVPASDLEVKSVKRIERVLVDPQRYVVDAAGEPKLLSSTAPTLTSTLTGSVVKLKIAYGGSGPTIPVDAPVYVYAQGGTGPDQVSGNGKAEVDPANAADLTKISATISLPVQTGEYHIVALVAGFPRSFITQLVP